MKENREKEKDERGKDKESGVVTRESVSAVCALFSALAFFILCTRSLIFGNIGVAVNSFLLGVFGYLAYPVLLGCIYLSVTAFIGRRFVRNRKIAAALACAVVFAMLIVHAAVTYSWDLSGYLSRCFSAPSEGAHGIDSCAPAGWLGGLVVYPLARLTTRIGAIVILSVLFLLSAYLTVWFWAGKAVRAGRRPSSGKGKKSVAEGTPADRGAPQYASPAPRQPMPQMQQPMPPQTAQVPYPGTEGGAVRPEVRQRPWVSLPDEAPQAPSAGYYAPRQQPVQPPVRQRAGNAFSPFGTNVYSRGESREPQYVPPQEPPRKEAEPEYANSREFLFGSTPAEIYRKNLIFDNNASVNKRPPADPDQPTLYSGTFAESYSSAYENSVNGEERSRPAKIVTDNAEREDDFRPFRNGTDADGGAREMPVSSGSDYRQTPVQPMQPIQPVQPVQPQPVQPQAPIQPAQPFAADFGTPSPRPSVSFPDVPREPEADDVRRSDPLPQAEREDVRMSEAPEEDMSDDRTSGRPSFMDIFSPSNPNIFGSERGGESDRLGRERADEDLQDSQPADAGRTDGFSDFGSRRSEEDPEMPVRESRRDAFDENPYTLRSDFSEREDSDEGESFDGRPDEIDGLSAPSDGGFGGRMNRADDADFSDRRSDDFTDGRSDDFSDRRSDDFSDRRLEEEAPSVRQEPAEKPREPKPKKPRAHKPYQHVPLDYFDCRDVEPDASSEEVENTKQTILETLEAFKVNDATIGSVTYGPTVTRYNVVIPRNIAARKVVSLDQEIAMNLYASKGVNIYPNFDDGAVSIEVPNKTRQFVQLGCMLTGDAYVKAKPTALVFAMGKDVANRKVYGDICKMTHLLVAGASGSGKSVFLRSLIISLIYKYSPQELRLILIDPKKTEFVIYDQLPHLLIKDIVTEVNQVIQSLNWAIGEMNRRYDLFQQMSRSGTYVVNVDEYNAALPAGEEKLAKIVIIVDELADLMLSAKKEVEDRIQNLTQKSRAAGIHLILATQRPSADVITGVIKGNLPTRIAFAVASDVDSRVILDTSGAQKLLGMGDLLYLMAGMNTPTRVQGASISSEDAQKVVNYIKANNEADFDESVSDFINNTHSSEEGDDDEVEDVYIDALRYIIQSGSASISMIQRKCSVGYNKAGKIIEWMEDKNYISAFDGAKARDVLITKEQFESKYGPL